MYKTFTQANQNLSMRNQDCMLSIYNVQQTYDNNYLWFKKSVKSSEININVCLNCVLFLHCKKATMRLLATNLFIYGPTLIADFLMFFLRQGEVAKHVSQLWGSNPVSEKKKKLTTYSWIIVEYALMQPKEVK